MNKFNLIDDLWIPCIMPNGRTEELGIKELLCKSHEIREIRDSSPIITLSIYRLLFVILQRIYDVSNLEKWETLYKKDRLDEVDVSAYLNKKPIYDRFYLFDPQRPFLQDSSLSQVLEEKDAVPLAKLAREMSATTNATLFDHSSDIKPNYFTCSQAARLLLADYTYCLADGTGYARSQCSDGINLIATGDRLYDTLVFNMVIRNQYRPIISPNIKDDVPVWENEAPYQDRVSPKGYLDFMTWSFRRLQIIVSENGNITHVYRKSGFGIESDWKRSNHDPMVYYKESDEKGYYAVSLKEEKALWRDYPAFINIMCQNHNDKLPYFINHLARTKTNYSLQAFGTCHGNADVHFWRHEVFPLSIQNFTDKKFQKEIRLAIDFLETKVANKLFSTIAKIEVGIKPDHIFWCSLEYAFTQFIQKYSDLNLAKKGWADSIKIQASKTWKYLLDSSGNNPRLYHEIIVNEDKFNRSLQKMINEYLEQENDHE